MGAELRKPVQWWNPLDSLLIRLTQWSLNHTNFSILRRARTSYSSLGPLGSSSSCFCFKPTRILDCAPLWTLKVRFSQGKHPWEAAAFSRLSGDGCLRRGNDHLRNFQFINPRRAINMHRKVEAPGVLDGCIDAITRCCHECSCGLKDWSFWYGFRASAMSRSHADVFLVDCRSHPLAAVGAIC